MESTAQDTPPITLESSAQPLPGCEAPSSDAAMRAENAFGFSLAMSGFRCIIKYVMLPFLLPLVGISGVFSSVIGLAINAVAILALYWSVRRFWLIDYKYKVQYSAVAAFAFLLLIAFTVLDLVEMGVVLG